MQIPSRGPFDIDIIINQLDLLGFQLNKIRDLFDRNAVVFTIEANIHFIVGQTEIEFILSLGEVNRYPSLAVFCNISSGTTEARGRVDRPGFYRGEQLV